MTRSPILKFFTQPLWKWAVGVYVLIEVLIQLNFYFKQYPDITGTHVVNTLLRICLFLVFMAATWAWCYYVVKRPRIVQALLILAGFGLYYFFTFIKNVYLLDFIASDFVSYPAYLTEVHFLEFFVGDLAYSKDDILRYTILVAIFYGNHFFYRFKSEEEKRFKLTLEKKQLEIDLMKWQLNPHFYFNTLNNLYGLASIKSDKTEQSILKLSDIMQYVIYECKNALVDLEKEISFLESYVGIERLRYEEQTDIRFEASGEMKGKKIIPLLLIQFVENGFKHGLVTKDPTCRLHILLTTENDRLQLSIRNTLHYPPANRQETIGLPAAHALLEACYKNQYTLHESFGKEEYSLNLILHLNAYQA